MRVPQDSEQLMLAELPALASAKTKTSTSKPEEQDIAHTLLIELLAHQFAFPVQWTETQDALLSTERHIARFVELGPAATLTNMARRTHKALYQTRDTLLAIERSFLACAADAPQVRYQYAGRALPSPEDAEAEAVENAVAQPPAPLVESMNRDQAPVPAATVAANRIADVPLPALDIVLALVALKLRKAMDQLPPRQSLKDISLGKSTLQNELIGDLGKQFGSLPDSAEDIPLATLAESLESPSSGQLTKNISEAVGRWIASIMPPKFNLNGIREYLDHTWGLGLSRQTSVILFAMTQAIADTTDRCSTLDAAKALLDTAVGKYASHNGLTLQKASVSDAAHASAISIDPGALEKISQDQRTLAKLQHATLAQYLDIDSGQDPRLMELEKLHDAQSSRLSLWTSEFGNNFELGIRPKFNAHHLRRYNFWWNQARNEVLQLYWDESHRKGLLSSTVQQQRDRIWQIANKSYGQTLDLVQAMMAHVVFSSSHADFVPLGEGLAQMMQTSIAEHPRAQFSNTPLAPRSTVHSDGSLKYFEVPRHLQGHRATYAQVLQNGDHATLQTQRGGRWNVDGDLTAVFLDMIRIAQAEGLSFAGKVVLVTGAGPGSIAAEIVKELLMGGATVIVTTSRSISDAQQFYKNLYRENGARGSELILLPFNQASVIDCEALIRHIYDKSGLGRDIDVLIPFAAMPEGAAEIDQLGEKPELAHRLMLVNLLRLIGFMVQQKTSRGIRFRPSQVLLPLSPNHGTFGGDGLYSESKLGLESLLNRFTSESWKDKVCICGVIIGWTRGTGLMEANDIIAEAIESHGALTFSQEEMALNILALITPSISVRCEDEAILADFGGGLHRLQDLKSITIAARAAIKEEQQCKKAIFEEDLREATLGLRGQDSETKVAARARRSRLELEFPILPDYRRDLDMIDSTRGMLDPSSTVVIVGYSELGPWGSARTRWQMESQKKLSQSAYIELAWLMGLIKYTDGSDKSTGHHVGWVDANSGEAVPDDQVAERYSKRILDHSGVRLIEPELLGGYDPQKKEFLQEMVLESDLPEFECSRSTAEAFQRKHGDSIVIDQNGDSDMIRVHLKAGARIMIPKAVPHSHSPVAGLLPTGWTAATYGVPEDIVRQVDSVTLYTLCCVAEAFLSAGIENPQEMFKHIHLSEIGNCIGTSLGGTDKIREMVHDVRLDKQVQGDVLQETNLNTPAAWVNMLLLGGSGPIKTPVGACATSLESLDIAMDTIASGKAKMCLVGGVDNFQEDESYAFSMMKATVDAAKQFEQGRLPSEFSRPTSDTRAGFLEGQGCGVQLICTAEMALEMGLPIYAVVAGTTMAADQISRSVPAPGKGLLTFARESDGAAYSPILDLKYRRALMNVSTSSDVPLARSKGTTSPADSAIDIVRPDALSSHSSSWEHLSDAGKKDSRRPATPTRAFDSASTIANTPPKHMQRLWGNDFRSQYPNISPMRAALAVYGLTIDDIAIVSLHGTSTKANDINEPETINTQMRHLGRRGPPLLSICQKSITGHPKAPAAAWMLNGCMQAMHSGLVPGNYNCDNIDPALGAFEHLAFPTEPVIVGEVKAFLLNSFGFGQKGAQMVGVNPKYLFVTLQQAQYELYAQRCHQRRRRANQAFARAILTNSIVKAQMETPYAKSDAAKVLLDPLARATPAARPGQIHFDAANLHGESETQSKTSNDFSSGPATPPSPAQVELPTASHKASLSLDRLVKTVPDNATIAGIGIDVESIPGFTYASSTFIERNYTEREQSSALRSRNPHIYYVSRWCAKEAVFKSLGVKSRGAGAAMNAIEICGDENGVPKVELHGDALRQASDAGVTGVVLSISYGEGNVIAVAVAQRDYGDDRHNGSISTSQWLNGY